MYSERNNDDETFLFLLVTMTFPIKKFFHNSIKKKIAKFRINFQFNIQQKVF